MSGYPDYVRWHDQYEVVAIPAVIFVVCFFGGVWASTRWLPGVARGPVGDIAFFAICGLIGAGLGVVGLHIYGTVRELEGAEGLGRFDDNAGLLASGLLQILLDGGTVLGLATVAYLLAPHEEQPAQTGIDASDE
jgi:hypothetical protein